MTTKYMNTPLLPVVYAQSSVIIDRTVPDVPDRTHPVNQTDKPEQDLFDRSRRATFDAIDLTEDFLHTLNFVTKKKSLKPITGGRRMADKFELWCVKTFEKVGYRGKRIASTSKVLFIGLEPQPKTEAKIIQ